MVPVTEEYVKYKATLNRTIPCGKRKEGETEVEQEVRQVGPFLTPF